MRIPGLRSWGRRTPPSEQLFLSRRPDESASSFEARMAAAASGREAAPRVVVRPTPSATPTRRAPQPREPRRRRGLGLIGGLVTVVAVLGALWIALAVREGSFSAGGAVVDRKIAEATLPAKTAASEAVDRTGQAVQSAGQAAENQGEKIRKTAN